MNIPVELFLGFIGISLVLVVLGIAKKVPALIVFAGMFILIIAVVTDNVIMGKIPVTSVSSGSTVTYTFTDNLFEFTEWSKVIFALFAVILMLVGALISRIE